MYALVSLWQMPEEPWSRVLLKIESSIAPLIGDAPGLVDSFWTYESANGKSVAFALLETADQAYDLRNTLERRMEAPDNLGPELEMIRVQEVVARLSLTSR